MFGELSRQDWNVIVAALRELGIKNPVLDYGHETAERRRCEADPTNVSLLPRV